MQATLRIKDFRQYCKENFKIFDILKQIEGKRKKPQIKTHKICWAIVNMVSLGIKSLLELDQLGRLAHMRSYIGTNRYMLASDTTYDRVLKLTSAGSIRRAVGKIYKQLQLQNLDKIKLDSGRTLRIAGIDASGFGKHLSSAVSIFGKVTIPLDVEPYLRKGKELPSSYSLIKRVTRYLGKGFCDILIGDGLYRAAKFFRLCKESGFDGLIKTTETRLDIIKDALGLYKTKNDTSIERVSGFDINRLCDYTIEAVGDIQMSGLKHRLKVVHAKEYYPKPDKYEDFFVITTKQDLTALEVRELAHRRWGIENNVFRQLSQLITSKKVHSHNQNVLERLLLLWYMGFSLVNAFLFQCSISFPQIFGKARETFSIKIAHMRLSLASGYG